MKNTKKQKIEKKIFKIEKKIFKIEQKIGFSKRSRFFSRPTHTLQNVDEEGPQNFFFEKLKVWSSQGLKDNFLENNISRKSKKIEKKFLASGRLVHKGLSDLTKQKLQNQQ